MENLKITELDWEQSGNGIFAKGKYENVAWVTKCGNIYKTEYIAKLMAASPRLLKSLIYAKSLIDKLEEDVPDSVHKLNDINEMIEIENIITYFNSLTEKVSFKLISHDGYQMTEASNSLLDIWKTIKNTINEPRNYFVEQINGKGDVEDSISAFYLIENFKDEKTLPKLITEIVNLKN